MPSLQLCGKKTFLAGDDLRTISVLIALLRVSQVVLAIPVLVSLLHGEATEDWLDVIDFCGPLTFLEEHSYSIMLLFLVFSLVTSSTGLLMAVAYFGISGRGTPTWTEPRRPLIPLCYLEMTLLYLIRILTFAAGVLANINLRDYCDCVDRFVDSFDAMDDDRAIPVDSDSLQIRDHCDGYHLWLTCYAGLLFTHWMDVVWIALSVVYFGRTPVRKHVLRQQDHRNSGWCCCFCCFCCRTEESKWIVCGRICCIQLSCLTCGRYGGREAIVGDLTDFSLVMKNSLDGVLDVTPSDWLAAVYTLKRVHVQEQLESKERFIQETLVAQERRDNERNDFTPKTSSDRLPEVSKLSMDPPKMSSEIRPTPQSSLESNSRTKRSPSRLEGIFQSVQVHKTRRRPSDGKDNNNSWRIHQSQTLAYVSDTTTQKKNRRTSVIPSFRAVIRENLNPSNDYERFILAEAARFISHAEAIYMWSTVGARRGTTANTKSTWETIRERLWYKREATPASTKRWTWTTANGQHHVNPQMVKEIQQVQAWMQLAPVPGIGLYDIMDAEFQQSMTATPYCMMLDHHWKSVVITIRGSASLEDMLTDLSLIPSELKELGEELGFDGTNRYCHRGILARTEWVYRDIIRKGVLEEILNKDRGKHPNHRLRITGHSLGAAMAAVLSLLLKVTYPNVRCLAYSPPGCTVCSRVADEMRDYVTSFILDSDVVGRTTVLGFTALRDELLEILARIQVAKYRVVGPRTGNDRSRPLKEFLDEVLCKAQEIQPSPYWEELEAYHAYQAERRKSMVELFEHELFPPGKIVQFFRTINLSKPRACCLCLPPEVILRAGNDDMPYTARWAEKEDFSRIVLTSHFLSDHETLNVRGQIHALAKDAGLKAPYFDSVLSIDV